MRVEFIGSGERINAEILNRRPLADSAATAVAADIIRDIRERGDVAIAEYTLKLDRAERQYLAVSETEIEQGLSKLNSDLLAAMTAAAESIREFHLRQKPQSTFATRADGALIGTKATPLGSVGLYVPGGRAIYPSTVLMNALPARVAGVKRIVLVTPPQPNGTIRPEILGAARLAGVEEIYAIGGAQAIAALAYGTETIEPVDKIVGPGNVYVAAAKRLVSGDVGIDMIAGPSEVAILADKSADVSLVAIDLLAQAEHDPDASTYLITTDETLIDQVIETIDQLLVDSTRQEITKASIDNNCFLFVCEDMLTAIELVNQIAPEHLGVMTEQPMELLGMIDNAGAIFLGSWTPQSVGDYMAGPSHTLPTGGTARFSSPLSIEDFYKRTSVISYSYSALKDDSENIILLAQAEGLWAHAKSVEMRFKDE